MAEQTTTSVPWSAQSPYLEHMFAQTSSLMGAPRSFFPDATWVDFAPQTEAAFGMQQQRALGGSPAQAAMGNYLTSAMNQPQVNLFGSAQTAQAAQGGLGQGMQSLGQMAGGGPNPYLDQMSQAAGDQMTRQFEQATMPGINATFGGGGRTGSGAHQQALSNAQQALGNQLGNMNSNLYGTAYSGDQNRRLAAAQGLQQGGLDAVGAMNNMYGNINESAARAGALAPSLAGLEYQDIDRLGQVGSQVENQQRSILQDAMNRHAFRENAPYEALDWYAKMIGGNQYGGTQTVDTGTNRFGQALGGAMSGAGMGSAFGPWGMGIGAGVGLLGGLFA